MSDPLTNTEVEDVLASIRRLVSDENRHEPKPVGAATTDRLVLTPALRVMDDDVKVVPEHGTPAGAELPDASDQVEDAVQDEDAVSEEPAIEEEDARLEVDAVKEEVAAQENVAAQEEVAQQEEGTADKDVLLFADANASPMPATQENANAQDHQIGGEVHDDGSAAHSLPVDPVGDDADVCDLQTEASAPAQQESPSITDGTTDAQHDLGEGQASDDSSVNDGPEDWAREDVPFAMGDATAYLDGISDILAATAAKTLGEKVAALETLVGKGRDNFEPDDTGAGENAGTEPPAMEWKDAEAETGAEVEVDVDADADAEVEVDAGAGVSEQQTSDHEDAFVETAPEDAHQEPAVQIFASDEDVLDEGALRELVSDIVREELQGALGERITRNVRKLVRREIHRALVAQDLE